jgi:hypothetical protein
MTYQRILLFSILVPYFIAMILTGFKASIFYAILYAIFITIGYNLHDRNFGISLWQKILIWLYIMFFVFSAFLLSLNYASYQMIVVLYGAIIGYVMFDTIWKELQKIKETIEYYKSKIE